MVEEWYPGSFTKNFSWGPAEKGLRELYDVIRVGFAGTMQNVPREEFRARVSAKNRSDYIPLNFFLYNKTISSTDFVIADELVFQALNFRHSSAFDKLALYTFHLSRVGRWKRAAASQSQPALWAYHYLADRVALEFSWDAKKISADDIERFLLNDPRYRAQTARKVATNLNYLYKQGRLSEFRNSKPERWWLSALFVTLDRLVEDEAAVGKILPDSEYEEGLLRSGFHFISGPRSIQKDIAAHNFVKLYSICGGRLRFSEDATRERQKIILPEIMYFANNPDPVTALHPTDPSARGVIPRVCAMLAHYVGFETLDISELDNFDIEMYVRQRLEASLEMLRGKGISPNLSAEEIMSITRDA
ncbi:hypothetical protein [Sandaracinobacteroides hominis]|uniref:hypothetical protein n=1 Tax=Sandaracinobacteroides hominis TaxID=2780086 RepID=UPI0018F6E5F7|nr:hypothetical protein [Sandaracinobacteroides hominis]